MLRQLLCKAVLFPHTHAIPLIAMENVFTLVPIEFRTFWQVNQSSKKRILENQGRYHSPSFLSKSQP